jgi:kynurenine 3-monooxygenase
MRDSVRDASFVRRRALALTLERRFPERFIPRYSMVMFHPEIPYAEALRRGAIQARLLEELDAGEDREPDAARAEALIRAQLPALQ